MKTKLMAMLLMAGSTMFAGVRFGVGVNLGVPVRAGYAAPVVIPPCPGPGYVWMNGYWAAPRYAPRYVGGHYTDRYAGGERHFDRDRDRRDFRR
jgi:WXXGXW repeat (2 copies)